jgi:ABC-type phosphate transport system substrate-binding protein
MDYPKMKLFHHILFLSPALSLALESIVQVHGTGTSNPSKCFWHILEEMETQSKIPTKMTYRSTSSGPGQEDFIGNITHPYADFSSGDYPFTNEQYEALLANGVEMLHLPALMGALGVFHSVPVKDGYHLNLTACIIASIYKLDIQVSDERKLYLIGRTFSI